MLRRLPDISGGGSLQIANLRLSTGPSLDCTEGVAILRSVPNTCATRAPLPTGIATSSRI